MKGEVCFTSCALGVGKESNSFQPNTYRLLTRRVHQARRITVCLPSCKMCGALPANWGRRDSNNLLQRICNSIPLFTSHDGCSMYSEATLLALLDGHVESCSMQALNVIAENFLFQEVVSFLEFSTGMREKKPGGLGRSKGVTFLRNYEVIVFSLWNQT